MGNFTIGAGLAGSRWRQSGFIEVPCHLCNLPDEQALHFGIETADHRYLAEADTSFIKIKKYRI